MKNGIRIISAFLVVLFVLSAAPLLKSTAAETLYMGDVNEDGIVSAEDARMILRCAVRLEKFNGKQVQLADMDTDSKIMANDAREALRTAVGLNKKKIFVDKHLPTDQYPLGKYAVSEIAPYGLKVKLQPGNGETIALLYDGDEVKVLDVVVWTKAEEEAHIYWGLINWDGRAAYVCMAYLEKVNITPEDFPLGRYAVSGTGEYGLKVKYKPGYGEEIAMLDEGDEVEVLDVVTWADADDEELRYWGKITWDGKDAYVCMAYLEKVITPKDFPLGRYVVSGTGEYGLKVKYKPGYGEEIAMLDEGDEVEVLDVVTWADADDEELRFWGKITWDGKDAYICMAYLEKVS